MNDVVTYDPVCGKFLKTGDMKALEDICKVIQELLEKDGFCVLTWGEILEKAFEIPCQDIPKSCYTVGWLKKEG